MTVYRKTDFPLADVRAELTSWGWDVVWDDTLRAEKNDDISHLQLIIDKGGRILLRRTAPAQKPKETVTHIAGRTFAIQHQLISISHVVTSLDSPESFAETLEVMLSLLNEHSQE